MCVAKFLLYPSFQKYVFSLKTQIVLQQYSIAPLFVFLLKIQIVLQQ